MARKNKARAPARKLGTNLQAVYNTITSTSASLLTSHDIRALCDGRLLSKDQICNILFWVDTSNQDVNSTSKTTVLIDETNITFTERERLGELIKTMEEGDIWTEPKPADEDQDEMSKDTETSSALTKFETKGRNRWKRNSARTFTPSASKTTDTITTSPEEKLWAAIKGLTEGDPFLGDLRIGQVSESKKEDALGLTMAENTGWKKWTIDDCVEAEDFQGMAHGSGSIGMDQGIDAGDDSSDDFEFM